jgi:DNA-binding FrmR family transcriptional regulator
MQHKYQTKLIHHLNRIEGQVRGLKKMVEEGKYCPNILTQRL